MEHKNTEVLQKTKMSTIGVVAIVFSFVAAGAFGIEEAISSSGPGILHPRIPPIPKSLPRARLPRPKVPGGEGERPRKFPLKSGENPVKPYIVSELTNNFFVNRPQSRGEIFW